MPTISRFYGIVIRMYFSDHPPPQLDAGERVAGSSKLGEGGEGRDRPRRHSRGSRSERHASPLPLRQKEQWAVRGT